MKKRGAEGLFKVVIASVILVILIVSWALYVASATGVYELTYGRHVLTSQNDLSRYEIVLRVSNKTESFIKPIKDVELTVNTNIANPQAYIIFTNEKSLLQVNQELSQKKREIKKVNAFVSGETYNVGWNVYRPTVEGGVIKFKINPKETPKESVMYLIIEGKAPQTTTLQISQANKYLLGSETKTLAQVSQ